MALKGGLSNKELLNLCTKIMERSKEGYLIVNMDGEILVKNPASIKFFKEPACTENQYGGKLNIDSDFRTIFPMGSVAFNHRASIREVVLSSDEAKRITRFHVFDDPEVQRDLGSFWITYEKFSEDRTLCLIILRLDRDLGPYDTREMIYDEFYSIFNNLHIPQVLFNEDLKIIEVNPTFKKTYHVNNKVIGLGFGDAVRCINATKSGCGNDGLCRFCELRRTVQKRLEDKENIKDYITTLRVVEGQDIWVNINLIPIEINSRKSFLMSAENITDLVNAENRINQARVQSLKLLDEMPLLVFNMTTEKTCDFLNQTFMNYIPVRKYNFLNSLKKYMTPDGFELLNHKIDHCISVRERVGFEVELVNHYGDFRMMQCQLKPTYDDGKRFSGFLGMFIDVQDRFQLELDLKRAKDNSETANKIKSEFLANMSHEIRTPLNGIVGMIDLTLLDSLSKDHQDNLRTAKECANSLLGIINDILDFSKMEAGKLNLLPQHFNLNEMVKDTVKANKVHADTKGVFLDHRFINIFEPKLYGDVTRIKQVLNNLVTNAIKFTHEGSVTIEVREKKALSSNELLLTFKVIDTGIGIDHSQKSMLFQRFSQIDGTFTREYGGTGLGLVISKQIMTMMKGEIDFTSQLGRGSTFYFTVPIEISSPTNEGQEMTTTHNIGPDKRLLVVEDDKINQMVIGKILDNLNINYEIANNGLEAVHICEENGFDAILMDIQMPVLDGVQATKQIRTSSRLNKGTPIIALTAYALQGDEALFRKSGMDDYLSKPLDMNLFKEKLVRLLQNHDSKILEKPKMDTIERSIILQSIDNQLMQIDDLFETNQFDLLETLMNQVKKLFDEIEAEELRTLSFKIELALRKQNYEDAHIKLKSLRDMFMVLYEIDTFKA